MRKMIGPAALLLAMALGAPARASYPCGIYARIDKVEVGPTEDNPEWVKVYGDFILVKTSGRTTEPQRGFMYFSIVKDREKLCRLEWADLKAIAGTAKNFVAFGSAHSEQRDDLARDDRANVHKPGGAAAEPIPYPLDHGLARLRTERPEESDRAGEGVFNRNPVVLLKQFLKDHPPERP